MQSDSQLTGGARLTVVRAEIVAGLLLTETDLDVDPTVRDASLNSAGTRVEITRASDGSLLAALSVVRAERALTGVDGQGRARERYKALSLPPAMLRTSAALIDGQLNDESEQVIATLLYAAVRRARILDRANLLCVKADAIARAATPLLQLSPCSEQLDTLYTQRVDLAAHYANSAIEAAGLTIAPKLRAQEVAETVRRWLSNGREWGLFRAVHARTLTRRQYVYALSNIYQFVRHTTRVLARCIAYSDTTDMRSHFIHHLNGEVNHELIIEHDLKNLGEDLSYVCQHMAPNGPTQEFMAIQESLIGFYQDPILLMASPMAAEGVTAHLDQAFVDGLHDCMRKWNVPVPEKASKFFVSHMSADGGEDGHWEGTVNFLAKCLTDEGKHQFFLRSMRNSMSGTQRLYDSFVEDVPSWTLEVRSPAREQSAESSQTSSSTSAEIRA
jgi:hypothetical protein